jgi:protein dithiol oxidoreductase (disulfide-forming)
MPRASEFKERNLLNISIHNRLLALTVCALSSCLALTSPPLAAQEAADNGEYRTLPSVQPNMSPGKIEVVEFFSYACPHCAEFYPLLTAWVAKLPKDVAVRKVPVSFGRPQWINMARAFYSLEASGDYPRLDGALFHAIHTEGLPLFEEPNLAAWVGQNGGNAEKFGAAYSSFGVNNDTVQADKMAEDYQIDAVPTITVGGKYLAQGSTQAEILVNAGKLIAKVRAENAGSAAKPKTTK